MILAYTSFYELLFLCIFCIWGVFFAYFILRNYKNIFISIFLILSFISLAIALLWVKWGYINTLNEVDQGNVLFVLDVSKSMNTQDVEIDWYSYSRMDFSKTAIKNYVTKRDHLYWLMIFAGEVLETLPFTSEKSLFTTILDGVDQRNVSKYGSMLEEVFLSVDNFFSSYKDSASTLVIFTDWGDDINISKVQNYFNNIQNKNLQVLIVWVGTKKWWYIPNGIDPFGRTIFKTYNWEKVISSLNSSELRWVSKKLGFKYMELNWKKWIQELMELLDENILKSKAEVSLENRRDISYFLIIISFVSFLLFVICQKYLPWRS